MEKETAEKWADIGARLQATGCIATGGTCGCLALVGVFFVVLMLVA